MGDEVLEYWNYNVPPAQRTAACPEALRNLSDKDVRLLSTWEHEYRLQTWDEVKQIVASNRIDRFQRSPAALRRYRQFVHWLSSQYPGGVQAFIMRERLRWHDTAARSSGGDEEALFEHADDYRVLCNDWPYGVDERIVHLVVWTKFAIPDDAQTGETDAATRLAIDAFVDARFGAVVGRDNVTWFRNWKSLKSVDAVEHFHVMLFDPDPRFVADITHSDKPYCSSWSLE